MAVSPIKPIDATPLSELDSRLERLEAGRPRWVARSTEERARLLRACMVTTEAVADRWAETACRIKGYELGSNGHGEEYLAGTLPTMRNLRLFAEALEAGGQPPLPQTRRREDGQWIARVFPQTLLDKALFTGITCDIWIEPGQQPTQGKLYRDKAAGKAGDGGICVVLGAGNQSSIPPMDVLYKLVVDDEVCILKMNPVNEALGPILAEALSPLIEADALQICYGGIEVGQHLTDHALVTSIHITGSAAAHDAIVWGPGAQGQARKEAGTPRLDKPITSELGCVSPVLVVPGEWSEAELDHHARQVASMLVYNCGFNCNGARLIVLAGGWPQAARFRELVQAKLAATPPRHAYYPTARATWDRFVAEYPEPTTLGEASEGQLPWTVLEGVGTGAGEFALDHEPWCGIFSFIELEATTAEEYLAAAVPFANDRCWGTLSINVLIHPEAEASHQAAFDRAIAELRYGGIAINCWSGLSYGLVNATWGAFPGHPPEDIQSGSGVVHNGLLLDHPQKSVVRAPFVVKPTPAWFTDHRNNLALGRIMTHFEARPSWLGVPRVALAALKG
ncbi:MAG TPA: aldehyde dehydrogenase [Deltaproteobacteria bacterium]|nr:aldehyde dehydrogenase [Deltaproteobacteria bacterium]